MALVELSESELAYLQHCVETAERGFPLHPRNYATWEKIKEAREAVPTPPSKEEMRAEKDRYLRETER